MSAISISEMRDDTVNHGEKTVASGKMLCSGESTSGWMGTTSGTVVANFEYPHGTDNENVWLNGCYSSATMYIKKTGGLLKTLGQGTNGERGDGDHAIAYKDTETTVILPANYTILDMILPYTSSSGKRGAFVRFSTPTEPDNLYAFNVMGNDSNRVLTNTNTTTTSTPQEVTRYKEEIAPEVIREIKYFSSSVANSQLRILTDLASWNGGYGTVGTMICNTGTYMGGMIRDNTI